MTGIGDAPPMTTTEERRILYRAVKRLTVEVRMTFDEVYASALGYPLHRGSGYEDNFRAGRIDRKLALAIYEWLHAARPDYGEFVDHEIEQLYQSHPGEMGWETLLTVYGLFGFVAVPVERETGFGALIRIETEAPEPVGARLHLLEPFTLVFNSSCEGHAIALQAAHGRWFPLPLTSASPAVEVKIGMNGPFPRGEPQTGTDQPPHFAESGDPGLRRMAVLVVPPAIGPTLTGMLRPGLTVPQVALDDMAQQVLSLDPDSWCLLRLNALFRN
jgi:hypothetical protein